MKIIGMANTRAYDEAYIITATRDELAHIAGFAYAHEAPPIGIGATIDVHGMYNRLKALEAAGRELAGAQKTLRAVADLIDPIVPAIEEAQAVKEDAT